MFSFKIPVVGSNAIKALLRWGAELRTYSFFDSTDFAPQNFSTTLTSSAGALSAITYPIVRFVRLPGTSLCFVEIEVAATLGTATAATLSATLPFPSAATATGAAKTLGGAAFSNANYTPAYISIPSGGGLASWGLNAGTSFALGTVGIGGNFIYEIDASVA